MTVNIWPEEGGRDVEEARQVWRMWMDLNENKRILRLYRDEGGGSKAAAAQGRCGTEDILVIIWVWRIMKRRGKRRELQNRNKRWRCPSDTVGLGRVGSDWCCRDGDLVFFEWVTDAGREWEWTVRGETQTVSQWGGVKQRRSARKALGEHRPPATSLFPPYLDVWKIKGIVTVYCFWFCSR